MYAFWRHADKRTDRQTDGLPQRIKLQACYREQRLKKWVNNPAHAPLRAILFFVA